MKRRLLIDLERMRYPNSGIATVFRNLAKGLATIENKNRLEISLFGPEEALTTIDTKFTIVNRRPFHKFVPFYSRSYGIVHTSHQLSSYFHHKFSKQKKIVTLHDLNFLHEGFSAKKQRRKLLIVKKNLRNADVIVCISDFTKQDLLANMHLFSFKKAPEICVIYNGLQFPEVKTYELGRFDYLRDKKYILNIGVLFPKKNQLSIIKMLPFIEEDLVIVASGTKESYHQVVLEEIERLGLKERVHIMSHISEEEKCALLQNCAAMCHPSLAEGFGIPPIEAMSFGKPVFLSKLTSLPEIGGAVANFFSSFETEHMVAVYQEGMKQYYTDSATNSEALKAWSSKFDYLEMAGNYLKLYKKLV